MIMMPCFSLALTVAEAPRKNVSLTKEKVKVVPLKKGTLLSTANSNQPYLYMRLSAARLAFMNEFLTFQQYQRRHFLSYILFNHFTVFFS